MDLKNPGVPNLVANTGSMLVEAVTDLPVVTESDRALVILGPLGVFCLVVLCFFFGGGV